MATKNAAATKKEIPFAELTKTASETSGIPEKDIKNSIVAVHTTIQNLVRDNRPKKVDDTLVIDARLAQFSFKRVGEQTSNGKVYPERVMPEVSLPSAYIKVANDGLDIKARPIEEKAAKKKGA